jgi:hypothetical protein
MVIRGRFLDRLNFLLSRRDIGGNGVLGGHDDDGRVVAPCDRITQLPSMILHRLGGSLDSISRGFRSIS